jgi:hypothetical protein
MILIEKKIFNQFKKYPSPPNSPKNRRILF